MTAAEYLAGPEDGRRCELVAGVIIVHEPLPRHQFVAFDLAVALRAWASAQPGRGRVTLPLDVQLDERTVLAPDILWYAEGRAPTATRRAPSPLPDLAVEIRSPTTWRYDIGAKKAAYERAGLPELWLVDTAADIVLAFRRSSPGTPEFDVALEHGRGEQLGSPLLAGFALTLDELFANDELPT